MNNQRILFKDFSLNPLETKWNDLVRCLIEAEKIHKELKRELPMATRDMKVEKAFSYSWFNFRFRDMVFEMIRTATEYAGGLEQMLIKKEKKHVR